MKVICPDPILTAGYVLKYWVFNLGQVIFFLVVWELIKFCIRVIDKDGKGE